VKLDKEPFVFADKLTGVVFEQIHPLLAELDRLKTSLKTAERRLVNALRESEVSWVDVVSVNRSGAAGCVCLDFANNLWLIAVVAGDQLYALNLQDLAMRHLVWSNIKLVGPNVYLYFSRSLEVTGPEDSAAGVWVGETEKKEKQVIFRKILKNLSYF
jgi:hypothetical protein